MPQTPQAFAASKNRPYVFVITRNVDHGFWQPKRHGLLLKGVIEVNNIGGAARVINGDLLLSTKPEGECPRTSRFLWLGASLEVLS